MQITVTTFTWKLGARIYQTDAQKFGDWFYKGGRKTAEEIAEACKSPEQEGHNHVYRYTDQEAVHQHRLDRARELMRMLETTVEVVGGGIITIPAAASIPVTLLGDRPKDSDWSAEVYMPITEAVADETIRHFLQNEAKRTAYQWFDRYKQYRKLEGWEPLEGLFREIEQLREEGSD